VSISRRREISTTVTSEVKEREKILRDLVERATYAENIKSKLKRKKKK